MKLPRDISGLSLAKALKALGYEITRQSGSHIRLTTAVNGEHHITIPAYDPIKIGTLAGYTMPGDVSASKRYWHEDVISPEVEVSPEGTITAPERPGIGFEVKRNRIEKATTRSAQIDA